MNLAFWSEAHKRAQDLLEKVARLDSLVKEGKMSELGTLFDRLRVPSEEFRNHLLTKEIGFASADLSVVILGMICLKFSVDGWRMFCVKVNEKDFNPIEFIESWHFATKKTVELFLQKCRNEAAETN